jgi:hypothetical protein
MLQKCIVGDRMAIISRDTEGFFLVILHAEGVKKWYTRRLALLVVAIDGLEEYRYSVVALSMMVRLQQDPRQDDAFCFRHQ